MEKLKLIGIEKNVKKELDGLKIYPRETYNDIVKRILIKYNQEVNKNERRNE